jgi:carotenoid cleavage dioxygenase-like enzyme
LTETSRICKLDPKNLEILKTINVTSYIPEATTTIAHPHVESDGSWLICGMGLSGKTQHYSLLRYRGGKEAVDSTNICEQADVICQIPSSHSLGLSYFHSFGVTENYIIFLEQSLKFSLTSFLKGLILNKSFKDALIMDENFQTRVHVVDKKTGKICKQKFITDPLFLFHHINAYEKRDSENNLTEIVCDICAYDPKNFDISALSYAEMFTDEKVGTKSFESFGRRITIPFNSNKEEDKQNDTVYCEIKDLNREIVFELPAINYSRFNGKSYKYFYGSSYNQKPFSIIKVNVENPTEIWRKNYDQDGKQYLPSEPVFVESPNPTSEDDGVLLVMVLSDKNDFLSILDAKNLNEIAQAVVPEGVLGAFTFHGFFADTKKFKSLND